MHGEDGSVEVTCMTGELMHALQNELMAFEQKDTYNMDETAL